MDLLTKANAVEVAVKQGCIRDTEDGHFSCRMEWCEHLGAAMCIILQRNDLPFDLRPQTPARTPHWRGRVSDVQKSNVNQLLFLAMVSF